MKPISVSQLNDYLARVVETDPILSDIGVTGEASGVKYHSSGHVYFSLVDEASKLQCFLPRSIAAGLPFRIADGLRFTCTGSVSIYKKGGSYSLYVRSMEEAGKGELALRFEEIKARLAREGIFDPAHKKKLPVFPRKIGVVTSRTGAAVRDILKTLRLRNDVCDVIIFPVLVQGEKAAEDIASMIDLVNEQFRDIDILIVGRGGGAAEDLWAFNEEVVARSIYRSRIPIISAVGHEIDFTISDMAADVRAATPTAAAQIAVPDTEELRETLARLSGRMLTDLGNRVMYDQLQADHMKERMRDQILSRISLLEKELDACALKLKGGDPRRILRDGYTVITGEQGIVTRLEQLQDGFYDLRLSDGKARVRISEITKEEDPWLRKN